MSKRRKGNRLAVPLMILLGATAGAVGLALYVKMTPADRGRPAEPVVKKPTPTPEPPAGIKVLIPVARMSDDGAISFTESDFTTPAGSDARVAAVNEFLRASQVAPAEAKLLQIDVRDGEADLQFSKELESGSGSFDEAVFIQGLRAVLGQFGEIRRFRLFADGQELHELGHFELGDPIDTLPVNRWNDPLGSDAAPPPSMPR